MSEFHPHETGLHDQEQAEQLYSARLLPDADDTAAFEAAREEAVRAGEALTDLPLGEAAQAVFQTGADAAPDYDLSRFAPNETPAPFVPAQPVGAVPDPAPEYDLRGYTPNEMPQPFVPAQPVGAVPDPAPEYDLTGYTPNEPSASFVPVVPAEEACEPEPALDMLPPEEDVILPEAAPLWQQAAEEKQPMNRAALYAALKTEAGMNTDMLEPLPTAQGLTPLAEPAAESDDRWAAQPIREEDAFLMYEDAAAPQPPEAAAALPADAEDGAMDAFIGDDADGAADAVIGDGGAWNAAAEPVADRASDAMLPAGEGRAAGETVGVANAAEAGEPSSLKSKAYAARAAAYANLKTEAGMNTDLTEPIRPGRYRSARTQPAAAADAMAVAAAVAPVMEAMPVAGGVPFAEAVQAASMAQRGAGQQMPGQEAPGQNAPVQQAPVQNAPVQQTPAQPAPVQPAPVQQMPVQPVQQPAVMPEAPRRAAGQNAPVQQAPVQPMPVQPVQQTPAQPATVQQMPVQPVVMPEAPRRAAGQNVPVQQTPAQPVQQTPAQPAPVPQTAAEPVAAQPGPIPPEAPAADTRPYPPLHDDAPTRIAPPLKRSHPVEEPDPIPPMNTAMPSNEAAMNMNRPEHTQEPVAPVQPVAPQEPPVERAQLAANLSAYYRRSAAPQQEEPYAEPANRVVQQPYGADEPSAVMNVYRLREASWAQEDRQTMLTGEDADGYQVRTEESRKPSRRKKKRMIRRAVFIGVIAALLIGVVALYLSHRPTQTPDSPVATAAVTPTPQPIRGYDAATAMSVSDTADQAIDQISADVEMVPTAVTAENVLNRNLRADGLYDFYLFSSDGTLLGYYDSLKQDGMCPMQGGGFYVDMPPYLVSTEGKAMISVEGLESTLGHTFSLRPIMNGWSRITADDGESNFIDLEGRLLSRLWFCRSFSMTGTESVAFVDTGVLQSPTRYTLYLVSAKDGGSTLKWKDAADTEQVVTAQLGTVYLQNGELYLISDLIGDLNSLPLCIAKQVRYYLDCNAMVVEDAATGKFALYVNGKKLYDAVYDSILPVESDMRWKGDILPAKDGQAMVLAISGAEYPQPLSYYFTLSRDGVEEHVALSAVTNCPILPDR
ncbi:MAG: hypothetical protein E7320_09315 [Clostridiales bacterium]|nr:hypothetical protein [Clostridiales bacterium]